MSTSQALQRKIDDRSAVAAVIGLGYVGLPLAMELCEAGYRVVGYDVSERVCALLMRGESHIQDVPAAQVATHVRSGKFLATTDPARLGEADTVSIAVPTPLAKTRDPDMSYVVSASDTVAAHAHAGMLIVLESTTYPGTTRELLQPRLEAKGLTVGVDVFLAFSPERVDPGNPVYHTKNTPKVVGGVTPACTGVATAFYRSTIDTVVPVSSPEAAELVKLLENTFRSVNIGLVNEMAIVCDRLGVDIWEVIDAAATKPFGFMKFTPGPGIGGHCIPLDPHYLAWKMRALNYKTRFIDLASEVNSAMPDFVVEKVAWALNDDGKAVKGAKVLVLGVAYKKDIDDIRESPALDVIRRLETRGAVVSYHDPHIPSFREEGHEMVGVALSDAVLEAADAVVVITDHSGVEYQRVADRAGLVVDSRNVMRPLRPGRARVVTLTSSR
ncbi:MAG: nucleotide sugar dehydrogenase [Gemmatimonadota bacterium]|nr:nucleotide sugar dehydrogenase [Gemmatimonadota bacterium]MDQ8146754.1 nucleotide sugar dehydrogenase [Gemmatimonadota bacterium]MDQ8148904.1 nucleotide sugar dehydrogenase [Gemmatimonadota bacterium]MDQ8157341.1 nucleotide sugar dehydrogenase [Gemmatimonadota bacterium]MDQ8176107.1 nucleotide sugar dehydrogenase [Gemmatimonadota bacterium]